jgi:hypothetical protein
LLFQIQKFSTAFWPLPNLKKFLSPNTKVMTKDKKVNTAVTYYHPHNIIQLRVNYCHTGHIVTLFIVAWVIINLVVTATLVTIALVIVTLVTVEVITFTFVISAIVIVTQA